MPLVVDKEAMRMKILMAFQDCIEEKPLTKLRCAILRKKLECPIPSCCIILKAKTTCLCPM